jgi:hypothetical protein
MSVTRGGSPCSIAVRSAHSAADCRRSSVMSFGRTRPLREGTLREHSCGHARPLAVSRRRSFSGGCGWFVSVDSLACPRFPPLRSLVRRRSTVRVRQRASLKRVLLARRHRYTGKLSFYRCWTPGPVSLSRLIAIAVARWRIEEDHQLAKQATGLDAGQVIRWKSWHRWTALCLLAYIYLAVAVAVQRQHDTCSGLDAGQIPITVPELLRLLRGTVIPPPRRDQAHRLHWSAWRRRHQHRARQAHQRWNHYAETTS